MAASQFPSLTHTCNRDGHLALAYMQLAWANAPPQPLQHRSSTLTGQVSPRPCVAPSNAGGSHRSHLQQDCVEAAWSLPCRLVVDVPLLVAAASSVQVFVPICIAGLLALKTAVVTGTSNITMAINTTWSNTLATPCHEIDPSCLPCPLGQCGSPAPAGTGPPRFYCNTFGVSCQDGRVSNISLGYPGLVFSQLPPQINQLARLREIGT